ncbi:hypothetical protein C0995_005258 [Termitomyces sp. Mi166|nr:hypothetical protein C0995_005258 [Termitomyces sp. Mi166\
MLPTCAGPTSQVVAMLPADNPPKGGKSEPSSKGKSKAVDTEEHPHWSAKKKGKGKAKDPKPSAMADEEVTSLLQHLHNAGVPEEVHDELLDSQLVQLAFIQLLDELDTTCQQHDKASSGKNKRAMTPPTAPSPKKACYQAPSPCLKAPQPSARVSALPYSEEKVLRGDDDKAMDLCADPIRVHTKEAAKPATNTKSVATETIAFLCNVPQGVDEGWIQVISSQSYTFYARYLLNCIPVTHHNMDDERDCSHLTSQASGSQGGEHYPAEPENNMSDYSGSELKDKEIEPDDNAKTHCLKLLKNKKKASQHKANAQKSRSDF